MAVNQASGPQDTKRSSLQRWRHSRRCVLLLAGLAVLTAPLLARTRKDLLRFEGQVTLPPDTISPRKHLILLLHGVETSFSAETRAGSNGRFRFRDLTPGTYSLAIFIPDDREVEQTVEITDSFADSKRTVRRNFEFSEQSLRSLMSILPLSVVSVRQLSIPAKSHDEYRKAQNRLEHNDADGALKHLQKAVALAPQFVEALNYLGTISYQRREYSKAERYFRAALEQDPQAYEPLVNLGGTLLAEGRWKEALEINQRAQHSRPRDPLANAQLGLSYRAIGEYEHAIPWFRTTEEMDPAHYTHPQIPLADIYLRLGDNADAMRELLAFLKLHPDAPEAQTVRDAIAKLQKTQGAPTKQAEPVKHLWYTGCRSELQGKCPPQSP